MPAATKYEVLGKYSRIPQAYECLSLILLYPYGHNVELKATPVLFRSELSSAETLLFYL
jgi:hypothetical protein